MARETTEEEQTPEVAADFPYRALMTHPVWAILDEALAELESNDDIELRTARRHVIGYLLQQPAERGQIPPAIAFRPDTPDSSQPSYRWTLEIEPPTQAERKKTGNKTAMRPLDAQLFTDLAITVAASAQIRI